MSPELGRKAELLILGGQVKTVDLADSGLRQRGIQEVDGVELLRSITKAALRIDSPSQLEDALEAVRLGGTPRKGPVFLELPLDAQAATLDIVQTTADRRASLPIASLSTEQIAHIADQIAKSARPVLLIGGGVERATGVQLAESLRDCGYRL